jgi:hypothetical protein
MINVERTLFYLERQFDQVFLEDVLDYVIPEFIITDEMRNEYDDTVMRSEKEENLLRNAKFNHRFVSFKK